MATSSDATPAPEHKHRSWFSKLPGLTRKLSGRRSNRHSTSAIADAKGPAPPPRVVRASSESPPPPSRAQTVSPKNDKTAGQPGQSVAIPQRTPPRQTRTPPRQTTSPRQSTSLPSPPPSVPVSLSPSGLQHLGQGERQKQAAASCSKEETFPELALFPVPPRSRPPSLCPIILDSEKLATESLIDEKLSQTPQVPKQSDKRQFNKQPPTPSSPSSSVVTRHRASSSLGSIPSTISEPPSPVASTLKGRRLQARKLTSGNIRETMSQLPEEGSKAQDGPNEESFVAVTKDSQPNGDGKDQNGTPTPPEKQSEKDTDVQPSAVPGDLSFAGAVREGLNGDDQTEEQDHETRSDESYPELDDMAIDEVPQSRARKHEPYQKIRWAPFHVPAKRRLQTLAVLAHCLCIGVTVSLFFACCANPLMWPLLLIYLMHVLNSKAHSDGSLRYRSEWFRSSYIWDLFAGYFPAKLHKTHDLQPTRKYIFGYHPHGIISHGAWAAFATEALGFAEKFPGITNSLLTLESNFRIPFYREYIMAMGMRSVSRESIVNILTRGGQNGEGMGRAVTIVIGGARESLEAQPGTLHLILKDRKGFVKIAVRTGADLVPVVAFGENDLYDQLRPKEHPVVHKIQMFILKVWKFTLPFLHGRGVFNYDVGMMPYRHPLNIVVGAPIKVRQSSHVDDAEIDRLHDLYVAEVQKLWDRYKDEFAAERTEELQIVS